MTARSRHRSRAGRKPAHEPDRPQRIPLPEGGFQLGRLTGLALVALALVGAAVSVYLTHVRTLVLAGAEGGGLCAVSDVVDCRPVLASPYASIAGVPLSVVGLWFYTVALAVTAIGVWRRRPRLPRSPAVALFFLFALATVVSVALAIVSGLAISAFCPLCFSLYVLNIVGLAVSFRAVRHTGEPVRDAMTREWSHWAVRPRFALRFAVLAAVPLAVMSFAAGMWTSTVDACTVAAAASRAAPLQLDVFSDFQCQHCRALHALLKPARGLPGLRIRLRHFPLDAECNPRVRRERWTGACRQARAALCADAVGKLEAFSDRLFDAGPTDVEGLVALAQSLGIARSEFVTCLGSESTAELLRDDVAAAIAEDTSATPAVFLNGHRLARTPTPEDVRCLMRGETK